MLDFSMEELKELFVRKSFNDLLKFYNGHRDLFVPFIDQEEKNGIIKNIYEELGYTKTAMLNTDLKPGVHEAVIAFKKISFDNIDELKVKISDFISGDSPYEEGSFGYGIYAKTGKSVQEAYSSVNKGPTDIVIENILEGEIITSETLKELKGVIIKRFNPNENYGSFLSILEDDGAFAAILGYSAITNNDTIVILDRSKLITYDNRIREDITRLKK